MNGFQFKSLFYKIIALALGGLLIVCIAFRLIYYCRSNSLCRQLHDGTYTHTNMGNGLSYPLWFTKTMQVFDWFYPEIPLVVACEEGNYEAVCNLLENGADPNYSIEGYTWTAIEATYEAPLREGKPLADNRLKIAKKLVEYGATVCQYNDRGNVDSGGPAFLCERFIAYDEIGIVENLDFLIENGAPYINEQTNESLLHLAAKDNSSLLCELMINKYKLGVDVQTSSGMTPLMIAAKSNSDKAVQTLLNLGAQKELTDNKGKSAFDYAMESDNTEIAELINHYEKSP